MEQLRPRLELEGLVSEKRDWAHLPAVALHLISEKLKSITDYVRFRAVCSPWRLASHPKPRHLPPQLPWLMIPYVDTQKIMYGIDDPDDGTRLFYDLWESKMRKIHIPEAIGKNCCASYSGWLLLTADKGSELFLLNPLTRDRVDLPPFTTPVTHIWDDEGSPPKNVAYMFDSYIGNYIITKVTFSSDLTDPNCIIMVFLALYRGIFFCRVGDSHWTQVLILPKPNDGPADAAYHNGTFYLLHRKGISIYDLSKHKVLGEPELCAENKFFVLGKLGLYLVAAHFSGGGQEEEESEDGEEEPEDGAERVPNQRVVMYKIQDPESRMEVKHIADTSDTTIFYGDNYHYLALCADDWDSLNGASMYMEYMYSPLTQFGNCKVRCTNCYDILFARLNDGESQPVANGIGEHASVFPPPPAIWFQASFV